MKPQCMNTRTLRVVVGSALLALVLAVGGSPLPASAQTAPTIPGVQVTLEYPWGTGRTTIQMTQPGNLTVRCTYESGYWLVNGVRTGGRCNARPTGENWLIVIGSSGNDVVSVDMRRSASARSAVSLGAGDDTGTLIAASDKSSILQGEDGNDNLRMAYASGWAFHDPQGMSVVGGAGNDRVRHDGFTGSATPTDGSPLAASLQGGPGADTVLGPDDPMAADYWVDHDDVRIRWSPVVRMVGVSDTPGADNIDVHLRGAETWITVNGRRLWIPGRAQWATGLVGQHEDNLTIRGGSAQTASAASGAAGNALVLRPFRPYEWLDQTAEAPAEPHPPWGVLRQPGLKDWDIGSISGWNSFQIRPY